MPECLAVSTYLHVKQDSKQHTIFTQIVVQVTIIFLLKNKDKTLQIVMHCDIIRGCATIKFYTHVHTTIY